MDSGAPNRLYARVAEALKARICKGEFAVGQRMPAERVLAVEYEVSRPTIREALFALEIGGFVEVRVGSGVYVLANAGTQESEGADMGPFEILEARRLIEGEVCAIAAARITKEQIEELQRLLIQIDHSGDGNLMRSEEADRRFHILIAEATQNSALVNAVEALWDARERSPEYRLMADKAHAAGVVPIVDEHAAIVQALLSRNPAMARDAMHQHLGRVLDSILVATEVHEVELAKKRVAAQRRKFVSVG
ncbi:FadR/GntR family transcriptional regulator [Sphingobium sp. YR768]|uniref:FadR/GntR family transcriptional regulator n=1 Tax=Sphingobium sp. YR768 TaxID=1884365 RepID=UPI0008D0A8C1|nr:FadR/GntR family transcriptional regulator [Sphingobium sp. YR768]SER31199.1 transcriptional regulator, GntR family [Sphingobium sp. YR768]